MAAASKRIAPENISLSAADAPEKSSPLPSEPMTNAPRIAFQTEPRPDRMERAHLQPVDGVPCRLLHRQFVERAQEARQEPPAAFYRLGAQRQIRRDIEVFAERKVLINDADTEIGRIVRARNLDRIAAQCEAAGACPSGVARGTMSARLRTGANAS